MTASQLFVYSLGGYLMIGTVVAYWFVRGLRKEGYTVEEASRKSWGDNSHQGAIITLIHMVLVWPYTLWFFLIRKRYEIQEDLSFAVVDIEDLEADIEYAVRQGVEVMGLSLFDEKIADAIRHRIGRHSIGIVTFDSYKTIEVKLSTKDRILVRERMVVLMSGRVIAQAQVWYQLGKTPNNLTFEFL